MSVRATADHRFNRRNIWLTLAGIALSIWGAYDAFVKYPKKLKIAEAYESLGELDPDEKAVQWNKLADENGWPRVKPTESKEIKGTIAFNYALIGVGLLMAVFFAIKFHRIRHSWIEADEKSLTTSWGRSVQFKEITKVNKIKWERKGIAKVFYKEEGVAKVLVLDDFKYLREPMGKIMGYATAQLSSDQIIDSYDDQDDDETSKSKDQSSSES